MLMDKILHYVASYLTGGQSDFLLPLSHSWHGIDVAPLLYAIAFLGAFAAITMAGVTCWRVLTRHRFGVPFLLALLFATSAYAASSTLSNLSAAGAISDTDLFYIVQTVGVGGLKATGAQLKTYLGRTTINTGCSATGGSFVVPNGTTTSVTISTKITDLPIAGATYTVGTNSECGGATDLNNTSTSTAVTVPAAGSGIFTAGWSETYHVPSTGVTATFTPASGTINGGASVQLLPGTSGLLRTDGSNYFMEYLGTSSTTFANPSGTAGPTANNGSATTAMRSDATPAIQKGSNTQFGIVEVDNSTIIAASGVLSAVSIKNNYAATTTPGTGNDTTQGYAVGSIWLNINTGQSWRARSVSTGAAVWNPINIVTAMHPGYVAGDWAPVLGPSGVTASSSAYSPNIAYPLPFFVPERMTVEGMAFGLVTPQAASGCQTAIYAPDYANGNPNRPGPLVGNTAALATTSAGVINGAMVSNVQMDPGVYFALIDCSTSGLVVSAPSGAAVSTSQMLGSATVTKILNGAGNSNNMSISVPLTYNSGTPNWPSNISPSGSTCGSGASPCTYTEGQGSTFAPLFAIQILSTP